MSPKSSWYFSEKRTVNKKKKYPMADETADFCSLAQIPKNTHPRVASETTCSRIRKEGEIDATVGDGD